MQVQIMQTHPLGIFTAKRLMSTPWLHVGSLWAMTTTGTHLRRPPIARHWPAPAIGQHLPQTSDALSATLAAATRWTLDATLRIVHRGLRQHCAQRKSLSTT